MPSYAYGLAPEQLAAFRAALHARGDADCVELVRLDDLPNDLTVEDDVTLPHGAIIDLLRALRSRTLATTLRVLAITPDVLERPFAREPIDPLLVTYLTESELLQLAR